ncbi:MAG: Glu/Leu/Phe/Val dehydrogenase dimerization domain-containing protein [Pseudomonadota bacterium]
MSLFRNTAFDAHERVVFCHDDASGLNAIIAIHSTALGPAAGGCRVWAYPDEQAAVTDALRLSRGMSYKNAMAGLSLGGGKAVVLKPRDAALSEAMLVAFGDVVESLRGDYITAEDVGMSVAAMSTIASRTRHVAGLPTAGEAAGGDPSPKTAYGVLVGLKAAVAHRVGRDSLNGLSVAVQGVGNVGFHLCRYLHEAGCRLFVADIDPDRAERCRAEFGATIAGLDDILFQAVDIVAPCALGAVLDEESIPKIQAAIVGGAANNQLATDGDGENLRERGILYCPDYVINAGGIISVALEYEGGSTDEAVMRRIDGIGERLRDVFRRAERDGAPTNRVADDMARQIIAAAA